jgi:hypothetical protein
MGFDYGVDKQGFIRVAHRIEDDHQTNHPFRVSRYEEVDPRYTPLIKNRNPESSRWNARRLEEEAQKIEERDDPDYVIEANLLESRLHLRILYDETAENWKERHVDEEFSGTLEAETDLSFSAIRSVLKS